MISRRQILPLVVMATLAGCSDWPDPVIPGAESARAAPWPALVPLSDILQGGPVASEPVQPSASRIAALEARAAALRGQVVDGATRTRMARGVDLGAFQGAR
ncbi:hypothetical protein JQU17_13545 [Ponticoccus sp. SC2-23]|uniref:hypothetical protein n=1 Tax=Alexandriicola marinus TaxID=2081710 RepID=UPI000FD9A61A|nr:hypothetical protein [Alexandriicola marinus]MBM1221253.1 hypothetical protein [Ponticoccus sp. SC6-9]MBM1225823.1 hypothetical protein [Ponticoccus sp. SC6-15]MBM1227975.1 hypothetical protein [Ponticoccus sp. SC6-38]MBM1234387.1 hypothetical protein [Ponticoccus sp. SC6-45]MBM1238477.1 hypothetical protein [Ponticoccus sp. SC6-49]MBM1243746.1 hypothetical protein [Ponticoccus sp. SC2-64]MBM1247911.1 hypothetical protein [Ponticoccus sp. SC6-42]MBM1252877.1 hypothetical protein [Pontico